MDGDGDDFMWDGLTCPPLEDCAFKFVTSFTPGDMFDDLLFQAEEKLDDKEILAKYINQDQELEKMVVKCFANPPTP